MEGKISPIPLHIRVLHVIWINVVSFVRILFRLYYGTEGKKIPTIKEDLLRQPAVEIARRIRTKEISCVEVVETFIRRIKDVNPVLNCFVEDRFEEALKEARGVDDLVRGGSFSELRLEAEKPFLGVPFTTKDCIGVKGLHLTCGVYLRKHEVAPADAAAVRLLRAAGALPLGLTNVPELCMWWESHNHLHGRSLNPYNSTRTVGGSSGGEGCLQAAAGSAFGVGNDIGGSIRLPSLFNGIFGHKPSSYIVPNDGGYPVPTAELHKLFLGCGPMVRHAVDLKPLLKVMAGPNAEKLNLDKPVDLTKLKIFYQYSIDAPFTSPVDDDILDGIMKVVDYFKVKHNIDGQEVKIEQLNHVAPMYTALMKDEVPLAQKLMIDDSASNIIMELLKSMVGRSNNTFITLALCLHDKFSNDFEDDTYNHYRKVRDDLEGYFNNLLGDDGVLLIPTHPTVAPYHNESYVRAMNLVYTAAVSSLGLPATAVPLGLRAGLPVGLQVVAARGRDRLCLAVAEELERAFGGWLEPRPST